MQRAGQKVLCSHFFRGRGQLDDFIFGGLADDVLFFQQYKKGREKNKFYFRILGSKRPNITHFSSNHKPNIT